MSQPPQDSGPAATRTVGRTVAVPPPARHPLHTSLVRVRAGEKVVGAGFLAADGLVCTCAHVVAEAVGVGARSAEPPTETVLVDFPFLGEARVEGWVELWRPVNTARPSDVALVRLVDPPPPLARPVRLLAPRTLAGHSFRACGFPEGSDPGVWARGVLDHRRADDTVQIESPHPSGFRVQPGFSGAPVWDERERGVVGMVVSSARDVQARVAFLIPVDALVAAAPGRLRPAPRGGPFGMLTAGVSRSLKGLEDFLVTYLGALDRPVPFGGRERQLADLDR